MVHSRLFVPGNEHEEVLWLTLVRDGEDFLSTKSSRDCQAKEGDGVVMPIRESMMYGFRTPLYSSCI